MAGEKLAQIMLFILAAAGVVLGVEAFFSYNIIKELIPDYAKWIFGGMGAIGAFMIYGMFKTGK